MKKHTKIKYRNYLSELRVDRKPISPDLPSYNPEFMLMCDKEVIEV